MVVSRGKGITMIDAVYRTDIVAMLAVHLHADS